MPDSRKRIADATFLLALMIYVLAGTALTPAHGDEFMQMAMARDFFLLPSGDWRQLAVAPPVEPDTLPYLRLINGTINKNLIGVAWALDGRSASDLPGIFAWEKPLDWNRQQGNVPSDDAIQLARWPSALLTALGVIPMFLIGWQLRLRSLAYPAALLYALHPVILLNGRRAMMEGSLMLTTLLCLYWLTGLIIAEHSATASGFMRRLSPAVRYGVLGLLIGLAVAAKQTGIVVAGAVVIAALIAAWMRDQSWRSLVWVGLTAVIGLVVVFILNPAYWNHPVGALRATLTARVQLLNSQVTGSPLAYTNPLQRAQAVITEPFLTPPQFYEAPNWAGLLNEQITAYQRSSVDGWDWGPIIGGVLTFLAGIGLLALIYDALHRDLVAWAILIWTGATVLESLAIPLAWQRYYLPLTLVAIVLAAMGLGRLFVRRAVETSQP